MSACYIPKTMEELGQALAQLTPDSLILAGGTDLVLHLRSRHLEPDAILSLSDLPQLQEIQVTPERAVIGAMAVMRQVQQSLDGLEDLQALADAAGGVGSPQIRNKGTLGGNVANASPAGDTPPVLWLLGAQAEVMGPGGGVRTLPVQKLVRESGGSALAHNEVILRFTIDRTALRGWRSAFEKLGHRSQVTISRIGMAVALLQDGDVYKRQARDWEREGRI